MGMGSRKIKRDREPQVSLEIAYELMSNLGIGHKDFVKFCGLKCNRQWTRWKTRGTMPEYRLIIAQSALRKHFDKDYQEKIRIINGE